MERYNNYPFLQNFLQAHAVLTSSPSLQPSPSEVILLLLSEKFIRSVLNLIYLPCTVPSRGPYIAAGVVTALLMVVVCVGVPVCYMYYCGWKKTRKASL